MQRVTVKTSTIFIAKGGRTRVYHSVNEVPQRLRKQLEDSTNGFNSATILIADRRGREELLRALKGMPSGLRTRVASSMQPQAERVPEGSSKPGSAGPMGALRLAAHHPVMQFLSRNWLGIVLPSAVGAVLWVAFNYR
jgi:hypothetical protein